LTRKGRDEKTGGGILTHKYEEECKTDEKQKIEKVSEKDI
jgi:hypothetical protein